MKEPCWLAHGLPKLDFARNFRGQEAEEHPRTKGSIKGTNGHDGTPYVVITPPYSTWKDLEVELCSRCSLTKGEPRIGEINGH